MKITCTIETTTDAEQLELAQLLAHLTKLEPAPLTVGDTAATPGLAAPKPRASRTKKDKDAAPAADAKADAGPTIDDVRVVLRKLVGEGKAEGAQKVLLSFGAEKLPDLKKADYAKVVAALEEV